MGPLKASTAETAAVGVSMGAVSFEGEVVGMAVGSENDAGAMTKAVKPLLDLARESDACVLLIHHSRKSDGAYGDEIRGSTALFGLADVAVVMKRHEVENQRKLCAMSRYPETPTELVVELREDKYVSLGDPKDLDKKARYQKMKEALSDSPEEGLYGRQRSSVRRIQRWSRNRSSLADVDLSAA